MRRTGLRIEFTGLEFGGVGLRGSQNLEFNVAASGFRAAERTVEAKRLVFGNPRTNHPKPML